MREYNEMLNQKNTEEDDEADAYNSDDEKDHGESKALPWWQFNTASSTMMIWDSFFSLVILYNIIIVPVSIVFNQNFHDKEEPDIDWTIFGMFVNGLWALYFFFNINRVDFVRKITTFESTCKHYLRSPFLVPDLIILIVS